MAYDRRDHWIEAIIVHRAVAATVDTAVATVKQAPSNQTLLDGLCAAPSRLASEAGEARFCGGHGHGEVCRVAQ